MSLPISFQPLQSLNAVPKTVSKMSGTELSDQFGQFLNNAINQLSADKAESNQLTTEFLQGGNATIDQTLIAAEKVSLGLELTVQMRNKMIEAYQEIMRMQM